MAFKSMKTYNSQRYDNFFLLRNDQDSADVVFLYRSYEDVLGADTHYIKSAEYSGYVHCTGAGCPACQKNIRVQPKLFIPLYNIAQDQIQFFDRSMRFDNQLQQDVFANYPNPSEYVFRITRHGVANDINTTYSIQVVGRNTSMPYDSILAKFNCTMPEHYGVVCKDMPASEMMKLLRTPSENSYNEASLPSYQITPRGVAPVAGPSPLPETPAAPEPLPFASNDVPVYAPLDDTGADANETIDENVDF